MNRLHRVSILFLMLLFPHQALPQPGHVLIVGGIYGLTGPLVDMSRDFMDSALLAIEEINLKGPVRIQLKVEDSRWDARASVSIFQKMTAADGINVFHVLGSTPAMALKPLMDSRAALMLAGASHPGLTLNSRFVLRHANLAENDARQMAAELLGAGVSRIGILCHEEEWSVEYEQEVRRSLQKKNPATRFFIEHVLVSETDYRTPLTQLLGKKIDAALIVALGAQAGIAIKQLRELGFNGRIFASNGFNISPDAHKIVKEAGICGFRYQGYRPPAEDYVAAFFRKYERKPSDSSVSAYTDMELLAQAYGKGGPQPRQMVKYLHELGAYQGRFERVTISEAGDIPMQLEIRTWTCADP